MYPCYAILFSVFSALTEESLCVGLARVGSESQSICTSTLESMISVDLGGPLHSLVIPGHMHPLELDMLKQFALNETVTEKLQELQT